MEISNSLKRFLSEPDITNLINNNEWEEVYHSLLGSEIANIIPELTLLLLEAGINPLLYLDIVPEYYLCDTNITTFTIPESVSYIRYHAFSYCEKLKEIKLPNSLKIIEPHSFNSCTSLKDIYYNGTKEEWGKIEIDKNSELEWRVGLIIHCNDGNINYGY